MKQPESSQESNIANQTGQTLSDLGDAAASQAADLAQQTEAQLRHAAEQAQAAAGTVAGQGQQKLSDTAQQTSDRVDDAARRASGILHSVAGTLRTYAPEQGTAGEVTQQVVEGLEQGSSFLEEQSRKGVVDQASDLLLRMMFLGALAVAAVFFLAWLGNRRE